MFDLDEYMEKLRTRIDTAIDERMPPADARPAVLHRAMRYAVLGGGKRLRPVLCLAAAEAAGGCREDALDAAVAVELLHAYTLIHDDLPCMDDDALRRGKPTCHVEFGEANAVLAGDALQALSFELAARAPAGPRYPAGQVVIELARAAGSLGIVGGQAEDISFAGRKADTDTVQFIHRRKTAELFRAAARMGAISADAAPSVLEALTLYAVELGLAFQIADDLIDAESGKPDPVSCLTAYGVPRAREESRRHTANAVAALEALPGEAGMPLAALAKSIQAREA